MTAAPTRRFTVDEYYRMSELGIFSPNERTELLNGEIFQMVAQGKAHAVATRRTGNIFRFGLDHRFAVHVQAPITLNERSEPQPDVTVTVADSQDFITHHPGPDEILLLIEASDSSLKHDLETKSLAYAVAGIVDYWVLDVVNRELVAFQQPSPTGYQITQTYTDADRVTPLSFKEFDVRVADLLPPLVP
ncbi:MAG: Uma2 family endonuclease [Cyanobacteria bacterium P01_A01_bin.105]